MPKFTITFLDRQGRPLSTETAEFKDEAAAMFHATLVAHEHAVDYTLSETRTIKLKEVPTEQQYRRFTVELLFADNEKSTAERASYIAREALSDWTDGSDNFLAWRTSKDYDVVTGPVDRENYTHEELFEVIDNGTVYRRH